MKRTLAGLILIFALGVILAPLATAAQPRAKVARIGFLSPAPQPLDDAFRQGLRELGYVEGQNIAIEYRYAQGKDDRLPDLATDLARLKVDIIVAVGTVAIGAAKQATGTIPIVMAISADPVGSGFVASLARPGGNITGLTNFAPELNGKRLELLKEIVPGLSRVAVLSNQANPAHGLVLKEIEGVAGKLRLQLQVLKVRTPDDLESAFQAAIKTQSGALLTLGDPMLGAHAGRIADLAVKSRLPSISQFKEQVVAGGLVSYGPKSDDLSRRAATYVDRILKGAKPADLPVEQPTRFELIINLKTAKALGLTIPQSVLIRADQVIR